MAIIKKPLYDKGTVTAGEKRLIDVLSVMLPDSYYIVPNLNIAITGPNHIMRYWEYDCIVVAPHAIFHIEDKSWAGNLTGDDVVWFRNGQEIANPHITANLKSRILASKIKNQHPDWNFGQIITLVTLSNPRQSKFGLDPQCECYKQTFTLNNDLVDFLTNAELIHRSENKIYNIQIPLVEFLTASSSAKKKEKREKIFEYKIEEVIQETEYFTEYLCVPELIQTTHYKIREYSLDIVGKSPQELEKFKLKIKNAQIAQDKISNSPYIVSADYRMNEEQTYYYEISRYQDESTLKSKLRQKTFKQTDKINIILDIAKALKVAHEKHVIHRNVSPENIYIFEDGKAALANFGLAWFVEHSDLGFTVSINENLQNSPYMAPEIIGGDALPCSDIYSLGVIFYELMVGKLPFDSVLTFNARFGGILQKEQLPCSIIKDLPKWIDEVVNHTIVADSDKRWQKVDELIEFIHNSIKNEQGKIQIARQTSTNDEEKTYGLDDMKPGLKVTNSMTLNELLGQGGFAKVFKVWHSMQKRHLAIKIFDRDTSIDNAINEYGALQELDHPNIVKFIYIDKTKQDLSYTLMELLEGDNLQSYVQGDLRLPMEEIYKMAHEILDALVYMQSKEPPLFHRDIKPSNIMWHKREIYKLIDFNIAKTTEDKSFQGTYPYMAPDLIKSGNIIDWDKSADTFSLGITIYQLLTHAYPWSGNDNRPNITKEPTNIQDYNDKLTKEISEFVMKSIKTNKENRFKTAKDMLEALESIGVDGVLKKESIITTYSKDHDPVDYINSLYSQSHHGNRGTRAGVREHYFDNLTYTETRLDKELIRDIQQLKYKLIIITGNAGDGKTAFIHRIEALDNNRIKNDSNNGSIFNIGGIPFESNYDGSQDEQGKINKDVLSDFFRPFYNLKDYTESKEGRIIAINEGRLVDFLSTHPELSELYDNIEEYFYKEGHTELLPGLMVINLNLRSVTAKENNTPSLLSQQVMKLTQPELWSKCAGCPIADCCYIKYNVDTFQDGSAGAEIINRLEWLVRTIVYKRELHITMRDLRSMIAWMLTRDYSCNEVKRLVEYVKDENIPEYYWQYYYFNLTAPKLCSPKGLELPSLASEDRLVKMLRETDIAKVAIPAQDRNLYYSTKKEKNYLIFSNRKQNLLETFNNSNKILPTYNLKDDTIRTQVIRRHKSYIRHQYFEGDIDFLDRLPYRYISEFRSQLSVKDDQGYYKTKQDIARAISASEGCNNEQLTKGYLLLSSSNANDPISKSYRRFPIEDFDLFVNKTPNLTKYIEYESDSLIFRHKKDKFIQLTVSLDLYEMLQYIHHGFSPSVNDLRGRFIELQIFKNLLEAKTYNEVLVTKNNRTFTIIKLDNEKHIIIKPLNY